MSSICISDELRYTRLGEAYPDLLREVEQFGHVIESRIGPTREILNLRLTLTDPEYCVVGRQGMSVPFAQEELTQLIAGVFDGERLKAITPRAAELITHSTAYGPRLGYQLDEVAEELTREPNSRRAVIYIGKSGDLMTVRDPATQREVAGEMPCTCLWQFHLRNDSLHMTVYMRSWDLVWGLSYDVPSFVAAQLTLAEHLGVAPGAYIHHAGSGHIYERHFNLDAWPVLDEDSSVRKLMPWLWPDARVSETRECALEYLATNRHAIP